MTVLDVAIAVIIMQAAAIAVLVALAWQEHADAKRQRVRAEEQALWADEFQRERDVAEHKLAALHELYLYHVRQSVAANTVLIYRNVAARRKS